MQKLRAWHGNVELGTEGICDFHRRRPLGNALQGLYINGLDRELIQALPERLRKAVLALNPGRPVNTNKSLANVRGESRFHPQRPAGRAAAIAVGYDGQSVPKRNAVRREARKSLRQYFAQGQLRRLRTQCRGELALDSVNFKDYQFTNVTGPIWIDDDRVLLGDWVDDPKQPTPPPAANPPRRPRPISANLFEGVVHGKGWIKLGADPQYGLEATLQQANLAKVIPGRQNLQGKIDAGIGLIGNGATRNGMHGGGQHPSFRRLRL